MQRFGKYCTTSPPPHHTPATVPAAARQEKERIVPLLYTPEVLRQQRLVSVETAFMELDGTIRAVLWSKRADGRFPENPTHILPNCGNYAPADTAVAREIAACIAYV